MKREIKTVNAPVAIGPYSQAVEAGGFMYLSGAIPVNPADGSIPSDIAGQARQTFQNMAAILSVAGAGFENVVKTTVFLTDLKSFQTVNDIYAEFFTAPYPARSCIEVSALPKGVLIECEAIAKL
jgi:endoribonuclease L-PSP, putative